MKILKKIRETLYRCRNCKYENINYEDAQIILKNNKQAVLLDVRSPQEYREGHLSNAINIPLYDIKQKIEKEIPNKETALIIYCQTGNRSKTAADICSKKGYQNIYNLSGRFRRSMIVNYQKRSRKNDSFVSIFLIFFDNFIF